jgi:hypothetical protein
MPTALPQPATPPIPGNRMGLSRIRVGLLIGLAILVIAGGLLGSLSLLTHFRVLSAHSGSPTVQVVRGGTWTEDFAVDPYSLIPDTSYYPWAVMAQQALYLPLFYGDAHGVVHPGAADLQSDSSHLPDGFPFHPALLPARCSGRTHRDT